MKTWYYVIRGEVKVSDKFSNEDIVRSIIIQQAHLDNEIFNNPEIDLEESEENF